MTESELVKEFLQHRKLVSFPIIDAHAHMGANYGTYMSMSSADDMIKLMDRENIEMIFCAPHSALFDPGMMNGELEEAMKKYPDRIKGYYTFNPNFPERYMEKNLDGCGVDERLIATALDWAYNSGYTKAEVYLCDNDTVGVLTLNYNILNLRCGKSEVVNKRFFIKSGEVNEISDPIHRQEHLKALLI